MAEENGVTVSSTGIDGLDTVLGGGIPDGHVVLVSGRPGTGKTVLSFQWLFAGATEQDQPGIYMAVTEPVTKALANVSSMDFYDEDVISSGAVRTTDMRSMIGLMETQSDELDHAFVDELVERLETLLEETGARRLVLDSVTALGHKFQDPELLRYLIFRLGAVADDRGITVFLTSESRGPDSPFNVEDFISDGIIHLEHEAGEQAMIRTLNVLKMRGVGYRSGMVHMALGDDGVTVYPKIPLKPAADESNLEASVPTGVPQFDELTGGGYPQGHVILVGGNTGAGKTTFGMQFLRDALERGGAGVYVNLEESRSQIMKTAAAHDWDFAGFAEEDRLRFVTPDLIDLQPDRMLHDLLAAVDDTGADHVFIDSISSLTSQVVDKEDVRQMLVQLRAALKSRGVTTLMTYLTSEMFNNRGDNRFGTVKASELRLSSLADGIVLLRYVEEDDAVHRILNVLKMRGRGHSKDIWQFDIQDAGINIREKLT